MQPSLIWQTKLFLIRDEKRFVFIWCLGILSSEGVGFWINYFWGIVLGLSLMDRSIFLNVFNSSVCQKLVPICWIYENSLKIAAKNQKGKNAKKKSSLAIHNRVGFQLIVSIAIILSPAPALFIFREEVKIAKSVYVY